MIKVDVKLKKLDKFKLEDISFEIPEGYICGLVGENGAGKTSLLHLLFGVYKPDDGKIFVDGMNFEENEKEIKDEIGVVLVEDLYDLSCTLKDNANFYGKFYSNYDEKLLDKYLNEFGLDGKRKYKKLSRGEKLKFQFAFALSIQPKILILDEPTGNFDPEFRNQFFDILKEFIADGTRTVILATHLTQDLDKLADYLIYLEKGKLKFAGDIEQFREEYRLVVGEMYKLKKIPKENVIYMEEKNYGAQALIRYRRRLSFDEGLEITYPTIEDFMYFMSKRRGKK